MDRTSHILIELEKMVQENIVSENMIAKVMELIEGVNSGKINLFDYRRNSSKEKYGDEIIDLIILADKRNIEKLNNFYNKLTDKK